MKIRKNYKLEKIEGVDMIELEQGDKFLLATPSTLGNPMIEVQINYFGKLVIKTERRHIEVQY